jgi:hypothetical protein
MIKPAFECLCPFTAYHQFMACRWQESYPEFGADKTVDLTDVVDIYNEFPADPEKTLWV